MLYNYRNCQARTTVAVVDSVEVLEHVANIDTDSGEIVQYQTPLRVVDGEVVSATRRFQSIHPIGRDRFGRPCLFHCYGERK